MWTVDNGLNLLSTQSTKQYVPWTGPSEETVELVGGKCETWILSQLQKTCQLREVGQYGRWTVAQ